MTPPPLADLHRDCAVRGESKGRIHECLIDIRLPSEQEQDVHLARISAFPQHVDAFIVTASLLQHGRIRLDWIDQCERGSERLIGGEQCASNEP
jgi:hypothetical protein